MLSKKENAVLLVTVKLCAWVGKMYVYPGRPKIVKLCKKWFSVSMSERTLTRVFKSMLEAGYLGRQRRPVSCPGGLHRCRTSMTFLTWRSLNLVSGLQGLSELVKGLTERTKMASNIFEMRRSSEPCGKLGSLIGQFFQKGGPPGIFSSSQKRFV